MSDDDIEALKRLLASSPPNRIRTGGIIALPAGSILADHPPEMILPRSMADRLRGLARQRHPR